jgi:protein SCO1
MDRRKLVRNLAVGAAMLPFGSVLATAESKFACSGPKAKDGNDRLYRFPNVVVTDQFGERFRFYDDLIKNKLVLLNFFYASCEERCPIYIHNLCQVQALLKKRMDKDFFIYSLTLDAQHDTPQVMRAYAEEHGAGAGWKFLTGKAEDLELLRQRLGFTDSDPAVDKDRTSHAGIVRYGNDRLDRWAACAAITNPAEIAKYIAWLEPTSDPRGRKSPATITPSTAV